MRKILVVVDMQNDFITGSLGSAEALAIVENVKAKIKMYKSCDIYVTRDTHEANYLETQEGKNLPVVHCVRGTSGHEIESDIASLLSGAKIIDKPTFGSVELAKAIAKDAEAANGEIEVELIGLCTDICVVSNALLIKAFLPEISISIDSNCCAGVTVEKHLAALETMRSCQIKVK